jgi:hypothetical protein
MASYSGQSYKNALEIGVLVIAIFSHGYLQQTILNFPMSMASPGEAAPQNSWSCRSQRGRRRGLCRRCRGGGQEVAGDPSRWAAGLGWPPRRTWAWTTCGTCPPHGMGGCARRSGRRWRSPPPRARPSTADGTRSSAPPRGSSRPWCSCSRHCSARPSPFASSTPCSASNGTG